MASHKPEQTPPSRSRSAPGPSRPRDASRRYIALRYTLTATYHESWAEAEDALADLPWARRAAIVDSQTGKTFASQATYPEVQEALGGQVLGIMSRSPAFSQIGGGETRGLSRSRDESTSLPGGTCTHWKAPSLHGALNGAG